MELFPFPEELGPLHRGHVLEADLHQLPGLLHMHAKNEGVDISCEIIISGKKYCPVDQICAVWIRRTMSTKLLR